MTDDPPPQQLEFLRLAATEPLSDVQSRAMASMAFAEAQPLIQAFEAADGRYDAGGGPSALEEARGLYERLRRSPVWPALASGRREEVSSRGSAIVREAFETTGEAAALEQARAAADEALAAAREADALLGTPDDGRRALAALVQGPAPPIPPDMLEAMRKPATEALPRALHAVGRALATTFERHAKRETIDAAVAAYDESRARRPARAAHTDLLTGGALLLRFKTFGDRDDIERAVEILASAPDHERSAPLQDGLGCALLARAEQGGGGAEDAEEAVAAFEAAVALDPGDPWLRANLATGLSFRFEAFGRRTDGERALAEIERALEEVPATAPDRLRLEQNAAAIRSKLGVEEAPGAARLLAQTPDGARARPARLGALATEWLNEFDATLSLDTLAQAIDAAAEGAALAAEGAPDRPSLLHTHGSAVLRRYAMTGADSDLEESVALLRSAVAATGERAPERAEHLLDLGWAESLRCARTGEGAGEATAAFRAACEVGLRQRAPAAIRAGRGWAGWAAEEGRWDTAADALGLALEAAERLHRIQIGRAHREHAVAERGPAHADAAVAMAAAGRDEDAAVALEHGRAQLLGDALDRDRAELSALDPALADGYREASARAAGTAATDADQAALDAVVERIRALPGHERFLARSTFGDLESAAGPAPLCYLAAGEFGGVALTVTASGVTTSAIPDLHGGAVLEHVAAFLAAQQERSAQPGAWRRVLADVTRWLGDVVWDTVASQLEEAEEVVLMPAGLLGLLPLHAAWRPEPGAPGGRRYAIDDVAIGYAPSARVLAACRELAARTGRERVLSVAAPARTDVAELDEAIAESTAVLDRFATAHSLSGELATRAGVLAAMPGHDVLHFACHGDADPTDPMASALLLAGEDRLTVADLLEHRLEARLAILSACETAVTGLRLPDEVVGLPAALLQAGVAGVVGSQWEVGDTATRLLVERFLHEWERAPSGPRALRDAQRWLRDATNAELAPGEEPPPGLADVWRGTAAYRGPEHWAAFCFVGA